MLSLYEILKASKTGIAPDMWTALTGKNWGGKDSGAEVKKLTGIPPLSFKADGTPLLDYLISGNMSQSGTPTPDNPVMPQGTGDKTANLFDKSKRTDNSRVVYTTGEISALSGIFVSDFTPIEPNTTYTLNIVSSISGKTGHLFALYDENKNFVNTGAHEALSATVVYTFTTPSNAAYIRFNGNMSSVDEIMLNTGSTPLPYEPHGYKIPISSANTTTPVYLGEVKTTRKIYKYEFKGSETWSVGSENYYSLVPETSGDGVPYSSVICSHCSGSTINGTGKALFVKKSEFPNITTGAELKQFCADQYSAGTPVCVWYVLATPQTAVVNEPLRKIGDYVDTLSYEQAGVQIPTLHGNTVIDVLTELKPSEMYIKYQE